MPNKCSENGDFDDQQSCRDARDARQTKGIRRNMSSASKPRAIVIIVAENIIPDGQFDPGRLYILYIMVVARFI